jgi:tetraacyldisaccharide 4'-kinase
MLDLLSPIFGLGVATRNALYDRAVLPVRKLQGPVISVGNLSVGGSGKTPFVLLLGTLLQSRAIKFDVLSRGYGRSSRGTRLVDAAGSLKEFGDEPLLLARHLGVPVIVGEDRHEAGSLAEKIFGPQLHLLDDGFQHRALARDFDIVLVTVEDMNDGLLPTGRLREPLASLCRADAVVLANGVEVPSYLLEGRLVWRVRRGIVAKDIPERPVVFCGIARPRQFFSQLRDAGVVPAAEAVYGDHHAYTAKDVGELLKLREHSGGGGFVTTEKDAINLGRHLPALEHVAVVPATMELLDPANALETMLRILEERRKRHERIVASAK